MILSLLKNSDRFSGAPPNVDRDGWPPDSKFGSRRSRRRPLSPPPLSPPPLPLPSSSLSIEWKRDVDSFMNSLAELGRLQAIPIGHHSFGPSSSESSPPSPRHRHTTVQSRPSQQDEQHNIFANRKRSSQ